MDSLIHYRAHDVVAALSRLAERTRHSMVFTAAPRTPATLAMLTVGKLFPRSDRSPAIEPIAPAELRRLMAADPSLAAWHTGRYQNIASGFYKSQAMEWVRP
jgi:magnesium-protoporphyrin O-methyltransferase